MFILNRIHKNDYGLARPPHACPESSGAQSDYHRRIANRDFPHLERLKQKSAQPSLLPGSEAQFPMQEIATTSDPFPRRDTAVAEMFVTLTAAGEVESVA